MTWSTSAANANPTSTSSEGSITAAIVESKSPSLNIIYSVVCAWCSEKEDYVAGYGDERVRICDTCYRDKKKFRRLQQRKYSFVSIY
jgi:hypothetical protein